MYRRNRYQYGHVQIKVRAKGSNVWVYRWRERDGSGGMVRRSAVVGSVERYRTKAEALRAAEHKRLTANPDNPNGHSITFGALIDRYIQEEMPQRFSTRASYLAYLRNHVKPKWGRYRLGDVKPFAVREWLKRLSLAPKSKVHIRNLMRILFNAAMLWELLEIQDNPMKLVRVADATKRCEEPKVLTVEEFQRLLNFLAEEPFRTMVLTAASLGLRCSELLALKWSDINWTKATLLVQRAIVAGRVDDVKTKYSRVEVPLDSDLAQVLSNWRAKTEFSADSDWIFASPFQAGEMPYRSWGVQQRHLGPAGIAAGIGRIGWHTLRHTYRSWLDETGAPLKVQQELMRHSDIRTTMNIYGAAMSESKRQANSKVVRLVLAGAGVARA